MKKITLVTLLLIMLLTGGLAEGNSNRELIIPELGIAFTLPEGFGENIADTDIATVIEVGGDIFRSANVDAGYELFVIAGGALYPDKKPTMVDKIKDKSNRFIWEEIVYGEYEFFIYKNELIPGKWYATIVFEDYYTPMIGLDFSEPNEDPFPLAEEILTSVRFLSDTGSE